MATFIFTGGAEGIGSLHTTDTKVWFPASGLGYLGASLAPNTIAGEVDIAFNAKLVGGADSYTTADATILGGTQDKLVFARSRSNLIPGYLSLNEANVDIAFKTPGLTLSAGIIPEDKKLIYDFTSVTFGDNTVASSEVYSLADGPSGAIKLKSTIGLEGIVEWAPPFLEGAKVYVATGPDGGFNPNASWLTTGQVSYSGQYNLGSTASGTTVSVFASHVNPAEATNEYGEKVSDNNGLGAFVSQTIGPVTASFGYAGNGQSVSGEGVDISSQYQGLNSSLRYAFPGDTVIAQIGYTNLSFHEDVEAFTNSTEDTTEHNIEALGVAKLAPLPGAALKLGAVVSIVDQSNQTNTEVHGNKPFIYAGFSYNGSAKKDF